MSLKIKRSDRSTTSSPSTTSSSSSIISLLSISFVAITVIQSQSIITTTAAASAVIINNSKPTTRKRHHNHHHHHQQHAFHQCFIRPITSNNSGNKNTPLQQQQLSPTILQLPSTHHHDHTRRTTTSHLFHRHYYMTSQRQLLPLLVLSSSSMTSPTNNNDSSNNNSSSSRSEDVIISLIESRYGTPPPPFLSSSSTTVAETKHELSSTTTTTTTTRTRKRSKQNDRLRQYVNHSKGRHQPLYVDNVKEVMDYLDEEFDNDEFVRHVLYSSPRILRKNVNSQLKPAVEFLSELYGESLFLEAISRNPDLLLTSGIGHKTNNHSTTPNNNDPTTTESYLKTVCDISQTAIDRMKRSKPQIFEISVDHHIRPTVTLLGQVLSSPGGGDEEETKRIIKKLILKNPSLLHLNLEHNLVPKINYLKHMCGEYGIVGLIKSCPGVLGLSLEKNLRPTVDFLSRDVGLVMNGSNDDDASRNKTRGGKKKTTTTTVDDKSDLRKCLSRHPQILGLSLQNLKAKVDYFDGIDALSSFEDEKTTTSLARRIAITSPSIYSLSLKDNIIPTVECLGRMWGVSIPHNHDDVTTSSAQQKTNAGDDSLSSLLYEYPAIITLSLQGNIIPTIRFFNDTGYLTLNDNGCATTSWKNKQTVRARHLATSLFGRLLPRWHYLRDYSDVLSQEDEGPNAKNQHAYLPPLHIMTSATDTTFCKHFGIAKSDYTAFLAEAVPRLKFSSQFRTWLETGRSIDDL